MGLDQQGRQANLGAVAVGKARVAFGAVSERLDGIALRAEALHGRLLQGKLGLAERGNADAPDFQAIGIVLIAAVPVVGIHDQSGPQVCEEAGHGARFRLGERPPIAVQVGMGGIEAGAGFGPIGVDHGHDIQGDTAQAGPERGVMPARDGMDQAQQGFGGGRLIAVLAAQNKQAHGAGSGDGGGVAQAHQPQRAGMHGQADGRDTDPGRAGSIGAQGIGHMPVRGDRR